MFMGTQKQSLEFKPLNSQKTHKNAHTKKHDIKNLDLQWKFKPKL